MMKGYDPHKLNVASNPKGKYANWNFQMEDIHEMMLSSVTCVFRSLMTTVLIQITSFSKCAKSLKVDAF